MFRKWWWLLLIMLLVGPFAGLFCGGIVTYITPRKFTAKAVVQMAPADPAKAGGTLADHVSLIRSRPSLEKVAVKLDLSMKWNTPLDHVLSVLEEMSSATPIRGTSLIEIKTEYTDPKDAAAIANTIASSYAPGDGSKVIVHEHAVVPQIPTSPNVTKNLAAGLSGGVLFGLLGGVFMMIILNKATASRPAVSSLA